jgi:hypothetical protein
MNTRTQRKQNPLVIVVALALMFLGISMTIDAGIAEVDRASTASAAETTPPKSDVLPPPQGNPQGTPNLANGTPSSRVIRATVTTYQAVPEQTDSTPCDGAMPGVNFCDPPFPIVANNCLAFGTKVEIRGQRYTVADRMASRYDCDGTWTFDILTDGENYALSNEPVSVL